TVRSRDLGAVARCARGAADWYRRDSVEPAQPPIGGTAAPIGRGARAAGRAAEMIWALIALVSLAVATVLAAPLLRARKPAETAPTRAAFDIAVYRDQLAELDRDHARGLLSDAERDAARLEIERRMLAVDAAEAAKPAAPAASGSWRAALAIAVP